MFKYPVQYTTFAPETRETNPAVRLALWWRRCYNKKKAERGMKDGISG